MSCQTSGRFYQGCRDSLSANRQPFKMGSTGMGFDYVLESIAGQHQDSLQASAANQATSQAESQLPARKSRRSLLPAPKTIVSPSLRTLSPPAESAQPTSSSDHALDTLKVGDRVSISGYKTGTLKFKGPTTFAQGEWYGVALDEPAGKHNGCVGGVQYFQCPGKHGIFVPLHKIQPLSSRPAIQGNPSPTSTDVNPSSSNTSADPTTSFPKQQKCGKPQSRIPPPRGSSGRKATGNIAKPIRPKTLPSLGTAENNSVAATQAQSPSSELVNLSAAAGSKLFQPRKVSPVRDQTISPGWSVTNIPPISTATVTKKTTTLPKIQDKKSLLPKVNIDLNSTFTSEDSKVKSKFTLPPTKPTCAQHLPLANISPSDESLGVDDYELHGTTQEVDADVNGIFQQYIITDIVNNADKNLNETFEITVEKKPEEAHTTQALSETFLLGSEENLVELNKTFDAQNRTFNLDEVLTAEKTDIPLETTPVQSVLETKFNQEEKNTPDLQQFNPDLISFAEVQAESTPDQLDRASPQELANCDISAIQDPKIANISEKPISGLSAESSPLCASLLTADNLPETFSEESLVPKSLAVNKQDTGIQDSEVAIVSQKPVVSLPPGLNPLNTSRLTAEELQEAFDVDTLLPKNLAVAEQATEAVERSFTAEVTQEEFQSEEIITSSEFAASGENPLDQIEAVPDIDTESFPLIDFKEDKLPPFSATLNPSFIDTSTPSRKPPCDSVIAAEMYAVNSGEPEGKEKGEVDSPYPENDEIANGKHSEMEEESGKRGSLLEIAGDSMEIPVDIIESHVAQDEEEASEGQDADDNHVRRTLSKGDIQSDLVSGTEVCDHGPSDEIVVSAQAEGYEDFESTEVDKPAQVAVSSNDPSTEETAEQIETLSPRETKLQHTDSLEVSVTESVELNGDVDNFPIASAETVSDMNGDVGPSVEDDENKRQKSLSRSVSDDGLDTRDKENEKGSRESLSDTHDVKTSLKPQENGDAPPDKPKESPTKHESPKKKSDVKASRMVPPLKLGTGDRKTNGTDKNIVSPQRSLSSSSSISRSRERLTSPTGRRGSLDSSRGTSPARSSTENLPKKTYTPSSWRSDKTSPPSESKDKGGILSPRRRPELQILPPKLNFATVKSRIDTGRKPGTKKDDKDGDDNFLKPDSRTHPAVKTVDGTEKSNLPTKTSKSEIPNATSRGKPVPSAKVKAFIEGSSFWNEIRGSKPSNRTTLALRTTAVSKVGERRGSSSSIASDISQKSDISHGSRKSSASSRSPRGISGGGASNPIPLRLQTKKPKGRSLIPYRSSTSKQWPPQSTESRLKSTGVGKGKTTSASTTTTTTTTSKVPVRPSNKSLSRIKSAQSASSASHSAAASTAATTSAHVTTSASSKTLSSVRRGSEHGTQSTSGSKQRPSSGRLLPATPSSRKSDQNREKRTGARSKATPASTSQPDLVSTSIASESVSKEIKRLEALCEARTKELTLMKIQFRQGLTGFDAMAVLVRYMTEELDAFAGPLLSKKLQVLQKELEDAQQLIAKQERELSDLHSEKTTLSEKHEKEVEKIKAETEELREDHKKELETVKAELNEEHKRSLETLEENMKTKHVEEKKNLEEEHSKTLAKVMSDYSANLQRIKAQHREELSELLRIQNLNLEELKDEFKEKLSKQHSEHQQLVDGMTQEYTSKMNKITTDFETKNRTLQDEVETLNFQCQNYKDRVKSFEANLHKDLDAKLQLAIAPYKDLQAEVESLKCVLELKRVEMHELRAQKNQLSKQLERMPKMEETIKKLEATNESLSAIVERKANYERQLSSEHLVLQEHFEKETEVNKRLSRENEELVWKLQNSDGGSLSSLTPSSTRSTLSPSPTHSHVHSHLLRESQTLSRSSSTDSHESGVFPLSPSQ